GLLGELAAERFLGRLARFDRAAGRDPERRALPARPAEKERAVGLVQEERAHGRARQGRPVEPLRERSEPAEALRIREGGGRRGRRGQDEEAGVRERAILDAELGALAERAAVRLLADERDRARAELDGQPLEALGRAAEVGGAQVARAGRRPEGGVRQAD